MKKNKVELLHEFLGFDMLKYHETQYKKSWERLKKKAPQCFQKEFYECGNCGSNSIKNYKTKYFDSCYKQLGKKEDKKGYYLSTNCSLCV